MSAVEVRPATGKAGIADFLAAARRSEAINPQWVETLHDETRMIFDPRRAPFARDNQLQPFVAYRDGEPVGRIVAMIEAAHIEKYGDACGQFGLLEAIDDDEVFQALFGAAEQFLRERGMRTARGPFSLTINQESGLLVFGFDLPHIVRTNHSPPHYAAHVERLGYCKAIDLLGFTCRVSEARGLERLVAQGERRNPPPIAIERLSLWTWGRGIRRVLALYNDAWVDNAWSTPVGDEEARLIGHLMMPVSRPGWIRIATHRGQDIAIMAQIPDANEALSGLNGKLLPFGFARILWRVHVRGTRRSRVVLAGVAKRWRRLPARHFRDRRIVRSGDRGRAQGGYRGDRVQLRFSKPIAPRSAPSVSFRRATPARFASTRRRSDGATMASRPKPARGARRSRRSPRDLPRGSWEAAARFAGSCESRSHARRRRL